jgi:hypothetical protein
VESHITKIHAVLNNHQAKHWSTLFETSGTIIDQTFSILINLGAIESFISSAVLKRIKVKESEEEEFIYLEIASGATQKVGGKVTDYIINLGYFVTKANLYVMILGSYYIVIGMD